MMVVDNGLVYMCLISGNASLSGVYWLGGSDNSLRGTYMWERGVAVDSPSHNQGWRTGEPNDVSHPQCIGAVGSAEYQYNGIPCSYTRKYVCKN